MVSLVAQKFLSDVAYEALQHCKMRGGGKEMKKVNQFTLSLVQHVCIMSRDPFSKEKILNLLHTLQHRTQLAG